MKKKTSYLVAGLGNPGPRYAQTRHNIGFGAVEFLAARQGSSFACNPSLLGESAVYTLQTVRVTLLKPQTYMNRSGLSVVRAVAAEQLSPQRLIVIHDDLDLPFGRIKIVFNRGDGGHNGVRSIIDEMAERDFMQIKCGIGRPPTDESVIDFVLSPFAKEEKGALPTIWKKIEKSVNLIVLQGKTAAMNEINSGD